MYPPKPYQENDFDTIKRTIATFPLATMISVCNGSSCITHVPLMHVEDGFSHGKLVGHMDKNNPHGELLDHSKVQIVFHGPDGYISPRDYSTKQLPTWNYVKVHIEGFCRITGSADKIKQSMVDMTRFMENTDDPFTLDINNPMMDRLINYVVGFEIEILDWEGKFKLSQEKSPRDILGASHALVENPRNLKENFIRALFSH